MTHRFISGLLLAALAIAGCGKMSVTSTEKDEKQITGMGLNQMDSKNSIRLEHVAINVKDPIGMAKWYCQNLAMRIVRKGPAPINTRFISDAGNNIMLELYNNPPDAVPDYASMDPLVLHIAFMVENVKGIREKLITAGATPVGEVTIIPSGDEIAMLRDPWGLAIQFVKRAEPMLSFE